MTSSLRELFPASFSKLLPALLVPALWTVASTAHAALTISDGFISAQTTTTVGWDFTLDAEGTFSNGTTSYATSIALDCSVNSVTGDNLCTGTLTLGTASANIRTGFDSATSVVFWSIPSSAPAAVDAAHEAWGEEIVPHIHDFPAPWEAIDFLDNGQIRHWYYTTTAAAEFEAMTGLRYEDYFP